MVPRACVEAAAAQPLSKFDAEDECEMDEMDDEVADEVPQLPRPLKLRPEKLRPETLRSSTDPSPSTLLKAHLQNTEPHSTRSRNRSPYSRSHLRSRSGGAALSAPQMTRAHSMPMVYTTRQFELSSTSTPSLSPASPMRSPARVRSPFKPQEDTYPPPRSPNLYDGAIESISEDSELEVTPRAPAQPSPPHATLPRPMASSRRRPNSPLHSLTHSTPPTSFPASYMDSTAPTSISSSGSSSPALGPTRFNDVFPSLHHYASTSSFSSIPSTPTSARSRSPSISSLETIEDAPDLESAAMEAEQIRKLKLAAEAEEAGDSGGEGVRRRSSLDQPRVGFGFTRGGDKGRKRWSICGGERRGDLDLETIWED